MGDIRALLSAVEMLKVVMDAAWTREVNAIAGAGHNDNEEGRKREEGTGTTEQQEGDLDGGTAKSAKKTKT